MFAKQASKITSSTSLSSSQTTPSSSQIKAEQKTPIKRKSSASFDESPAKSAKTATQEQAQKDVIDLCNDSHSMHERTSKQDMKVEPKVQKINAWDNDELEYVDEDATENNGPEARTTVSYFIFNEALARTSSYLYT
jgi:hypothetical protein